MKSLPFIGGCGLLFCLVANLVSCGGSNTIEMSMNLTEANAAKGPYRFYTNGFPTDLRKQPDGSIDASDFPRQGHLLTKAYVNSIPKLTQGYHTVPTVYLPFTGALDERALPTWDPEFESPDSSIQLIDIDPESAEYGRRFPLEVTTTAANGPYRPANLLQVQPTLGVNLRQQTTYAVIVLNSIKVKGNARVVQNTQLKAALTGNRKKLSEAVLKVYQPLRQFLQAENIDVNNVVGATVWTTGTPFEKFHRGAEAVAQMGEQMSVATLEPLELFKEFEDYCVIRSYLPIPGFQKGPVPYLFSGGQIEWDEQGRPIQQYSRRAEFVVTIPKHEPMPEQGFPILNYIHGATGRAHQVYDRGEFERIDLTKYPFYLGKEGNGPSGIAAQRQWASSGMAGHLSVDHVGQVLSLASGFFVYSPYNPVGMQGSYYQMAWERIYFRRVLAKLRIAPELCPDADTGGSDSFKFDPDMQVSMGQSQGHWVNGLVVVADPKPYQGVIFTGLNGSWTKLFSNNEMMRWAVNFGVTNQLSPVDDAHPFLSLMEWLWGSADPTANLDFLMRYPSKEPPHVIAFSGYMDFFLTEDTQRTALMAIGTDLVGDDIGQYYHGTLFPHMAIAGNQQITYPVVNNFTVPGYGERTSVVMRYRNDNPILLYTGHEVTFQRPEIKHQYGCFLEHLGEGRAPVVGVGVAQGDPCL